MTLKDAELTRDLDIRPSSTLLWISILTGPVAFAINFQSRFALVQWACGNHRGWVLTLIALTALVAAIASALLAWMAFTRFDGVVPASGRPSGRRDGGTTPIHRARFMAISGFILSAIFALAIVAQLVPHFFLGPCD